jgi:hypothetical protein
MISFASGLPLLQVGDRGVSDYSSEWLETSVRAAAAEAGHDEWWFATDIVRSLFLYLKERFHASVITVNELFEKLRLTLVALGFNDIADHLHDEVPPVAISLVRLANEAMVSGAYEFRFFQRLEESLDSALGAETKVVQVQGLKTAVRRLCGAKRWSPACEKLHKEILTFMRSRVEGQPTLKLHVN